MKKAIISLIILVAAATVASYELLTPPVPQRHFAEVSEDSTANSVSSSVLENAVTLPDHPVDTNLAHQAVIPIVTASALDSEGEAEQADEGEKEEGKDKETDQGRPDRMWGAVKLG